MANKNKEKEWDKIMKKEGFEKAFKTDETNDENGGLGVWNCPGTIIKIDHRGMEVTIHHQRLNAAEEWITSWSPALAKGIRSFFDVLEERALKNKSGLLWHSGKIIFPFFGLIAAAILWVVGRNNTIALQYIKA